MGARTSIVVATVTIAAAAVQILIFMFMPDVFHSGNRFLSLISLVSFPFLPVWLASMPSIFFLFACKVQNITHHTAHMCVYISIEFGG